MAALLQDPVILGAGTLFLAGLGLLFWIIGRLQHEGLDPHHSEYDPHDGDVSPQSSQPLSTPDTSCVTEARLQDISAQLMDIDRRLASIEKAVLESGTRQSDALIARIKETVASVPAASPAAPAPDELGRIEAKLEGIHKLLIILTDNGMANDR